MIFFSMSKGTKSFGHDKALACESRGFVYNKKGCIVLTHPLNNGRQCYFPLYNFVESLFTEYQR